MILEKLMNDEANFADVIAFIEDNYTYTASAFTNASWSVGMALVRISSDK